MPVVPTSTSTSGVLSQMVSPPPTRFPRKSSVTFKARKETHPFVHQYYLVADAFIAVNYGNGDLKGTCSRGYKHTFVFDGGFEGYTRDEFCFAASSNTWVSTFPVG
ncbi:hypothetical protein DXG01_014634, partial [Tephrocybe rancida]